MTPVAAVTLGVFDGFHRGHAEVVARARERAREVGGKLVVFTFDEHPRQVLAGGAAPPRLSLLPEKTALLREAGADEIRVLRFTPALAARSPAEFLAGYVFPFHRTAAMVVGYDFAMGRGRRGTLPVLAALGRGLGFTVESVGPALEGGEPISSTRIRGELASGRVDGAARLLGRPYRLEGTVTAGDGRGRVLGFPTANLEVADAKQRPARGVYAVWASGAGLDRAPAVMNLGVRPTFDGRRETVEVHVLDRDLDLRGRRLAVEFAGRVRDELKFKDAKELQERIRADVALSRRLLGAGPGPQEPA